MMMMKDARRSDENSVKTWLIHEIARSAPMVDFAVGCG
jgi:hypothetical protein